MVPLHESESRNSNLDIECTAIVRRLSRFIGHPRLQGFEPEASPVAVATTSPVFRRCSTSPSSRLSAGSSRVVGVQNVPGFSSHAVHRHVIRGRIAYEGPCVPTLSDGVTTFLEDPHPQVQRDRVVRQIPPLVCHPEQIDGGNLVALGSRVNSERVNSNLARKRFLARVFRMV